MKKAAFMLPFFILNNRFKYGHKHVSSLHYAPIKLLWLTQNRQLKERNKMLKRIS